MARNQVTMLAIGSQGSALIARGVSSVSAKAGFPGMRSLLLRPSISF
jgi:hypothetical protein